MTSVQDYLRNLRAARSEFVNRASSGAASTASPAVASSTTVSSPWLKTTAVTQSSATAAARPNLGQGEPVSTDQPPPPPRATSTPVKPAGVRRQRVPAGATDSDTDTDISHLIDQLSFRSAQKPPPAPPSASAGTAVALPPRRANKMDMLRRKFSASSPTKSWTDQGSSGGGGGASLGRARTRSRSSVSIMDQKIILSGISGDEDSTGSSGSSSEDTSSSGSAIPTESAPGARRARRSPSDDEVSERLDTSVPKSTEPILPSASSVQTATEPTAVSVGTESVQTEQPSEASVSTETTVRTETSETESETTTVRSVSDAPAKSKLAATARSDSKSVSESETDSELRSESSVQAAEESPTANSSKATPKAAAAPSRLPAMQDRENERAPAPPTSKSRRKQTKGDGARSSRTSPKQHEMMGKGACERTTVRSSKHRRSSGRRSFSPDRRKQENTEARASDAVVRDRTHHRKRSSRPHDKDHLAGSSRSRRHIKSSGPLERTRGAELNSTPERRRRRQRDASWPEPERDMSWPEPELERTDASESLVVSYQRRRVTSSSAGCRHCRRQAWPPPPQPPVTVVVPPATLGAGAGVADAVRLGTSAGTVFVEADEDTVLSTILTQQVILTRHFLATQKHLHEMYRRALRETQQQVYTHRDDLKASGRRRERFKS